MPLVITMAPGSQAKPRAAPRWSAMAARRPSWPNGCGAPATVHDGRRHSRSTSRAHSAKGNDSRSG